MAKRRYKISEFVERKRGSDLVEIETDDGQVFEVDPPSLWRDEVLQNALTDQVSAARGVLGDRYDDFVKAGGSAMMLLAMLNDDQGVDAGESPASQPS